jgi:DNA-directed RNA polymerase specialized sigma24 family protein
MSERLAGAPPKAQFFQTVPDAGVSLRGAWFHAVVRGTIVSDLPQAQAAQETAMDANTITRWIDGLKAGDQEAARQLWDHYFQKLVRLAGRKLPAQMRRTFDEEDVALSAFKSFCAGVAEDRFPQLNDRDNLWAVLVIIAVRKAQAYLERQTRQKRGGGQVRGDSVFLKAQAEGTPVGFDALVSAEPTPAFTAQVAEECQRLLDALGDESLQTIAVLKMQGHTIDEIAAGVGCTKRAVQRRLEIIRRTWQEKKPGAESDP